ncbi:uncharacterized protein LOC132725765 [Ruditapes philippinarum]|uniref:uncharacterized protein LOC132725765 n=1 Tax=Ruditapes philippinarum TaxID=129788 RepID=UPI00295BA937|nr:uncharacterized protein LOC132725765 [Ruditapes philippinarum]
MEQELLQEADAIFQINLKRIESNMKEVDSRITVLQESLQKINAAKRENESEKYVQIKRVNEERKIASDCLKDFERPSKTGRLRFDPYRHETGSECNTIGSILHLQAIEVEKCFGEFNVRIADDRNRCDKCDMCLCKSGCIVMTDYNNKRIKKMNNTFKVISSLKLSSNPFGICEINSLMLAISVYQGKILLTSQEDPMTVTNSFDVFGACRGIAYNDGRIYVCCDGNRDRSESPGQIKVFSISGVFQCELSYHGGIELPQRLAFTSSSKGFFVIDGFKGINHVDKMSGVSNNVGKKISGPSGICNIDKNLFCIAVKSCNLLLMSHDGKDQVEMLIKHAGKTNRSCMCFDNKTSRLVVYHIRIVAKFSFIL